MKKRVIMIPPQGEWSFMEWGGDCLLLRTDGIIQCPIFPKIKMSGVIYVIAWGNG